MLPLKVEAPEVRLLVEVEEDEEEVEVMLLAVDAAGLVSMLKRTVVVRVFFVVVRPTGSMAASAWGAWLP